MKKSRNFTAFAIGFVAVLFFLFLTSQNSYSQEYYYLPNFENVDINPRGKEVMKDISKNRYNTVRLLNRSLILNKGQDWKDVVDSNLGIIYELLYDLEEIKRYHDKRGFIKKEKSSSINQVSHIGAYAIELLRLKDELQVDKLNLNNRFSIDYMYQKVNK